VSEDLRERFHEAAGSSPLRRALGASRTGVAVKLIEFEGCGGRLRGVPLALRTLNADENLRLRGAARTWLLDECRFSEAFIDDTDAGRAINELEVKIRTIALALVEPAPPHRPVAKNPDELRLLLDADEVSALFELFLDWVQERSPISTARSAEEVRDLVDALGKGTQPTQRLLAFDSVSLRSIAIELAGRWRTLMSSPSSPTSPSSDTETTSSDDSD